MFVALQESEGLLNSNVAAIKCEGEGAVHMYRNINKKLHFFMKKCYLLAGRTETSGFSSLLLSDFLFQGSSKDFWVSDDPCWLHCSFLCLSRSCSSPPAWPTFPWLLLLQNLDFSLEKKTFGAQALWKSTRKGLRAAEISTEAAKPSWTLVAFGTKSETVTQC